MKKKTAREGRLIRTISVPPDQDRWLVEMIGDGGNLSAFIQTLIEAARSGAIDSRHLVKRGSPGAISEQAIAYLKATEGVLHFEEDVFAIVKGWVAGKRGLRVRQRRLHDVGGVFLADISVESANGAVVLSVSCKPSPRSDRLQLALGEAVIGSQKTGKPVVTVVPYFLAESRAATEQFKSLGLALCEFRELPTILAKIGARALSLGASEKS